MLNPTNMKKFSTVVLDEIHRNTIDFAIICILLRYVILPERHGSGELLRILLATATPNNSHISRFFEKADVVIASAPIHTGEAPYPVKNSWELDDHSYNSKNYLQGCWQAIGWIRNQRLPVGRSILCFVTGKSDVEQLRRDIIEDARFSEFEVCPLHSEITELARATVCSSKVAFPFKQILIIATNTAQSSVTIENVGFVVDCGLTKIDLFDHKFRVWERVTRPITKAAANQRAGRAGRMIAGECVHLYTESDYNGFPDHEASELLTGCLDRLALRIAAEPQLKQLGEELEFPLPSQDSKTCKERLASSRAYLASLGALESPANRITELGVRMLCFSVQPILAKMLLDASTSGCSQYVSPGFLHPVELFYLPFFVFV